MIVTFEINNWADWAQFNTLFAELHDINHRPLCAALADWMRIRAGRSVLARMERYLQR